VTISHRATNALLWIAALGTGLLLAGVPTLAAQSERTAAELLPPATAIFTEIADTRRCGTLPGWQWLQSAAGVDVQELPGWEHCHLALACESAFQNPMVLVRGLVGDEVEAWKKALSRPAADATRETASTDVSGPHRNIPIELGGRLHMAVCGDWLIASASRAAVEAAIDRHVDTALPSLATENEYLDARQRSNLSVAWCFVRPEPLQGALRATGVWKASEHPVVSRVWDEFVRPMIKSPYVALSLEEAAGGLQLAVVTPENVGDSTDGMQLLGGLLDAGNAFKPLLPPDTILSSSMYVSRDALAALNRLVTRDLTEQFAETPADKALLEAGIPLINDILEQMRPEVQVVLARPTFAPGVEPQVRLPAVAVIFRPADPDKVKSAFILSYLGTLRQSNLRARAVGGPTFVMASERRGDALIAGARYRTPQEDPKASAGMLQYNLCPAMAVVGNRFILSSNHRLVMDLVELAQAQPDEALADNLQVDVGLAAGMALLADNLEATPDGATVAQIAAPLFPGLTKGRETRTLELPTSDVRRPLRARLRMWRLREQEL